MKRQFVYSALAGAVSLCTISCVKENLNDRISVNDGDEIVFGVSAAYDGPKTKTEYGDIVGNEQKINWTAGDRVEIYSPDSPTSYNKVEYAIANIGQSGDNSHATLAKIEDAGLHWGDGDQSFYAVYPSKNSIVNEDIKEQYKFENGILTAYVPVNQQHTITKGGATGWTAKPNMEFSYMAAEAHIAKDNRADGVDLLFKPLVSTLEITLSGKSNVSLNSINIVSNNPEQPIAGLFTCDLTNHNENDFNCTCPASQTLRTQITVPLYYQAGNERKAVRLAEGESITVNVFLLPHMTQSDLSVRVSGLNVASVEAKLVVPGTSDPIDLSPHKKTRVKLPTPTIKGGNRWVASINDDVLLSQLSIPATANSFSYMYSGESPDIYKTQVVNFARQWASGVRCFELRGPNNESGNSLSNVQLQCNRTDLGVTFGQAVSYIKEALDKTVGKDGKKEFAIIMPAFESGAGRGGRVTDFANDLNQFCSDLEAGGLDLVTYRRNITVGELRGKVMVLARITSEEDGENYLANITPADGVVYIDQWGSLKDNWQRRGYPVPNWGRNDEYAQSMEYHMLEGNNSSTFVPNALPSRDEAKVNFIHKTKRSDGSEGQAYVQDWARVVKESKNYWLYTDYESWPSDRSTAYYAYWKESLTEKQNDIWNTFLKSIDDNDGQMGASFYINSLDGYYVDPSIPLSYKPYVEGRSVKYWSSDIHVSGNRETYSFGNGGIAGNIGDFAKDINAWYYTKILGMGEENIYGPMNIVILDRVFPAYVGHEPVENDPWAPDEEDMTGGDYLPQVIIDNNFRFPLLINGAEGTGSYDSGYQSGGNIIK